MRAAYALMLAVALSACGDDKTVEKKDASAAEVAKSVADAGMKLNPGRWELTMNFAKFEIEGMPPEAKKAMEQMLGQGRTYANCLTKEEAEKPDGAFFGQEGADCRYEKFSMGSGKVDATMTCKGEGPEGETEAKMTMAGTYSANTYAMKMDMQGAAPNGKNMNMTMAIAAKHVGDCKGDEES